MTRIITRPFFCGKCRGKRDGFVALFGSHTNQLFIQEIEIRPKDITPHLIFYRADALRGKANEFKVAVVCGIDGCGVDIIFLEDGKFIVEPLNSIEHTMTKDKLLNLIAYKDQSYFVTIEKQIA